MSYATCRQCHRTVHESDVVQQLTGSPTRDCTICCFTCPVQDSPSDLEVWMEYSTTEDGDS
jgi:hypothetical protein